MNRHFAQEDTQRASERENKLSIFSTEETQSKSPVRRHYAPPAKAVKNLRTPSDGEGLQAPERSHVTRRTAWQCRSTNIRWPRDPVSSLLGVCLKKRRCFREVGEPPNLRAMVKTALFIIASNWKPPQCPLTGEWPSKLGCSQAIASKTLEGPHYGL